MMVAEQAEDTGDLVHPDGGTESEIHVDICAKLDNSVRTLFQGESVRRGPRHARKTHKRKHGGGG